MNKIQKRRMQLMILFIFGIFIITGLILFALRQNINVFMTPEQIAAKQLPVDYHFRLGGLVKTHSLVHDSQGLGVEFQVTDFKKELTVRYNGVLPDLFREGKGVIADGSLNKQGVFVATEVLAKHDENYVPKTVPSPIKNEDV